MAYKESIEYANCTVREKAWLEAYLTSDALEYLNIQLATEKAFEISPDNSLAYGRAVLARPRIKKIVESALDATQLPTLEEFKLALWKTTSETKDLKEKLGALTLYADISGWRNKSRSAKSADDETKIDPLKDLNYGEVNDSSEESNSLQ
jgi:hypothetical protein